MKINLLGDLCLSQSFIWGDSITQLLEEDETINIMNLESPLTDNNNGTIKAGPHLKGVPALVERMSSFSQKTILCLSNNHIMDFGEEGVKQTINEINKNAMHYTGIGRGEKSNEPFVFEIESKRIGILNRCEEQFGLADIDKFGVSKIDATIYNQILELKKNVDFVIVSIHAASEMFPWPSPEWQKFLRSLIDAGADLIHGHHAHVPQCFEKYNRGYIFYGLGNFVVDYDKWKNIKNATWSIIPIISICDEIKVEIKYSRIYKNNKGDVFVDIVKDENLEECDNYMKEVNNIIKDSLLHRALWQENSIYLFDKYYEKYILRYYAEKKVGIVRKRKEILKDYSLLYHLFACVSHKDAIKEALGIYSKEIKDYRTQESSRLFNKYLD